MSFLASLIPNLVSGASSFIGDLIQKKPIEEALSDGLKALGGVPQEPKMNATEYHKPGETTDVLQHLPKELVPMKQNSLAGGDRVKYMYKPARHTIKRMIDANKGGEEESFKHKDIYKLKMREKQLDDEIRKLLNEKPNDDKELMLRKKINLVEKEGLLEDDEISTIIRLKEKFIMDIKQDLKYEDIDKGIVKDRDVHDHFMYRI